MNLNEASLRNCDPEDRKSWEKFFKELTESLQDMAVDSEKGVVHFLTLINSGGAVSALAFFGAAYEKVSLFWMTIALIVFLIGVVLCGAIVFTIAYRLRNCVQGLSHDVATSHKGEIGIMEVFLRHQERVHGPSLQAVYWFCFGSLGAFVLGGTLLILAVHLKPTLVPLEPVITQESLDQ
jgi:hypothetical protein